MPPETVKTINSKHVWQSNKISSKYKFKPVMCEGEGKHQKGILPKTDAKRSSYDLIIIQNPRLKDWNMSLTCILSDMRQWKVNLWRNWTAISPFDVKRSFENVVTTIWKVPTCISHKTFINFIHLPVLSMEKLCFSIPLSKISLKIEPTGGNIHNISLGKTNGPDWCA